MILEGSVEFGMGRLSPECRGDPTLVGFGAETVLTNGVQNGNSLTRSLINISQALQFLNEAEATR